MTTLKPDKIPEFVITYLVDLQVRGRQPSTIKRYRYDIEDFFKWWSEKNNKDLDFDAWRQLSEEEYDEFFTELLVKRNYSARTYERIVTVLTRLCVFYERLGYSVTKPNIDMSKKRAKRLTDDDFIGVDEINRLYEIIPSNDGLSEIQMPSRPKLINRNLAIVNLFYKYGLTLQELVSINMEDVNFIQHTIAVSSLTSESRLIKMEPEDSYLLFSYYQDIPEPVRPKQHSRHPLFVAFDFWRETYRWVYSKNGPKRLSEVSIQKMLRQETGRAGLKRGVTPQHMRNTAIINSLKEGMDKEAVQKMYGFRTVLSVERYLLYLKEGQLEENRLKR